MKISACVITKNEEMNISSCLASVKEISDEIILVDTGSKDNTVQEALRYDAKIYYFQWQNDFSKARNYAISKAKGDWIIFLDADEYYTKESITMIRDVLYEAEKGNYDVIFSILVNYEKNTHKSFGTAPVIRIFRNNGGMEYKGAVHELLNTKDGRPLKKLDATKYLKIIHTGYSKETIDQMRKGERNLDLLLEEEKMKPNDSNLCFYISEAYFLKSDQRKALEYSFKVLEYNNGTLLGIYQKNYLNMIGYMLSLKFPRNEVLNIVKEAVKVFPDFPDFRFFLGDFYKQDKRYNDSIEQFEIGLQNIDKGINYQSIAPFHTGKALYMMAELYYICGQVHKSIQSYVESLKSDLYGYNSLKNLIKIFIKSESSDEIFKFMRRIYDYDNIKDILLLLRASLDTSSADLAGMYFCKLDESIKKDLGKEQAYISILNRSLGDAADEYKKLYLENYKYDFAVKCIMSAQLSGETVLLAELSQIVKPTFKRMIDRMLGKDIIFLDVDKNEILELIKEYIKCGISEQVSDLYHDWIAELRLYFEVAEISYHFEQYGLAAEFYNKYIENEISIPSARLSDTLARMGVCMYQLEQYELTIKFFEDVRDINPYDYRAYELPITILEKIGSNEQVRTIAEKASHYFSDSNFIKSKLGRASV